MSFLYRCANARRDLCHSNGSEASFAARVEASGKASADAVARKRRKWKTKPSMTLYGKAYFFSKSTLMKMFVAPALSDDETEVCSAAISVRRSSAAAEWRTGTDTRTRTEETIVASRSVQLPSVRSGNKKPLKKAAGLYRDFLSALKR